jgi:GTP-binding protein Era
VSIVSPKVQTTRRRVLGIAMCGPAQLVLVDTPGIFAPRRRLDRAMVRAAWEGASDADLVLLIVDASRKPIDEDSQRIIDGLKEAGRQAILVLNKIDLVKRTALLALAERFNAEGCFSDIFMISAESGDGVDDLRDALVARVPPGAWHYPEDQVSDLPMRLLAAEVTREHLFRQLHEEVPYALTVETDSWEEFEDGSAKLQQTIYVQRDGQKAIVLGKGGRQIKAVREAAQGELESMLERKVHLFLFVKVRERWPEDPERYRELGLDYDV